MRVIKFRAWDKKMQKMRIVNSVAFHFDGGSPKVVNLWGRDIIEDKDIILHREAKDVELMQFTGLLDKNGTEIYEGDIVQFAEKYFYLVKYEDAKFVGYHANNDWDKWGDLYKLGEPGFNKYTYVVIGNIYENPELLKEVTNG
jgi:uncharacterized phage protein (TIGR01671 family)